MSCVVYSRIEEAVSLGGCAPAGAKALDDIGFASMGAVDRSYRCSPRRAPGSATDAHNTATNRPTMHSRRVLIMLTCSTA